MKWFYLLMVSVAVAVGALAVGRITNAQGSLALRIVICAALVAIFISFFGFLSRTRE